MSMPRIEKSESPIDREQSVSNLVESVARMETGLSHILNAEGEKIQKVVNNPNDVLLDDMIKVNDSAQKMVNSVSKLEMILQNKLDTSKELDTGEVEPLLIKSSYVEAIGDTQTITTGGTVLFSEDDVVGTDIEFAAPGSEFIINSPGLYLVEWSVNLSDGSPQSLFGITENDEPTSALTNSASVGNTSSGALIYVENVPYAVKLHNFGPTVTLENPIEWSNTCASIRILKFADAPQD